MLMSTDAQLPPIYNFHDQLHKGVSGEQRLNLYFSKWFDIKPPAHRNGQTDRIFVSKIEKRRFHIQYKCDEHTKKTGNVFLETVSVDYNNTPGWLYTYDDELKLIYYAVPKIIYFADMGVIKSHYIPIVNQYREVPVLNEEYITRGILVPIGDFGDHCFDIRTI
jgi:hypothetical protein